MRGIRIAHILAGIVASIVPAAAQDWPTRPVTMVVPFAAGSGSDVVGRLFASHLSGFLGQQVIVENAGAAGGTTGTARVAKAAPDGYQLLLGTAGTHAYAPTLYKSLPYNAATDFAPVALLVEAPSVLVVRRDLPTDNLEQFIAHAKANQAKMQFGSAGTGSSSHLVCVLLNAAFGVDITHIPYRGGPPAMQDLIAGRIDYHCPAASSAVPQIEGKTVKGLAMLTKDRSSILPNLPTAHEQGLTDFAAGSWYALFFPKRTPGAIVEKLHKATLAVMNAPAVQQRLREIGADLVAPERRSPEYLAKFVVSEIERWAGPIRAAGITVQ